MNPHAPSTDTPQLYDDVLALLPPLREMQANHQSRLNQYRNADSEPIRKHIADVEETRREIAIEASDALANLVARLEQLVADPPLRAHTIVVTDPARDEVDDFVVNATSLHDAVRVLASLPSYQRWLRDEHFDTNRDNREPYVCLPESHPGTRAPGTYWDLRGEQAQNAIRPSSARTAPTPAAPSLTAPAPRCSR